MPSETGKRLTFTVPSWVDYKQRDIYLLWGREVIGRKLRGKKVEHKTVRCNFCGACCRNIRGKYADENGVCRFLEHQRVHHADGKVDEGWFCMKPGDQMWIGCVMGRGTPQECVIRFAEG